jgi:predicted SprT family Zn-dependent metalloprotease
MSAPGEENEALNQVPEAMPGQLLFSFAEGPAEFAGEAHEIARGFSPEPGAGVVDRNELREPAAVRTELSAAVLEEKCRQWLHELELPGAAKLVKVQWNTRLKSTAGYASYPAWKIELNPRLKEFEGQVERTLKHELAHLIAYHRAGRRRIEPHGAEWRMACALLGIPEEKACHQLPLPRTRQKRSLAYLCPACGFVLHRVRRFRRPTACMSCCTRHSQGQFDTRFRFELLKQTPE